MYSPLPTSSSGGHFFDFKIPAHSGFGTWVIPVLLSGWVVVSLQYNDALSGQGGKNV
jgi:hypothetical protein